MQCLLNDENGVGKCGGAWQYQETPGTNEACPLDLPFSKKIIETNYYYYLKLHRAVAERGAIFEVRVESN